MTPRGHFAAVTKALKSHTRYPGTLASLQAFLRSDTFRAHFAALAPEHVEPTIQAVVRAKAHCEARTPMPAKPKQCWTKGARIDWRGNPALRARLARAYAKHGPLNHKAVAAELRISVGQARQAKLAFLDAAATIQAAQAA